MVTSVLANKKAANVPYWRSYWAWFTLTYDCRDAVDYNHTSVESWNPE